MNPKVSITILNWNGWEDTIECLESLYQITYPNYNVILVDNGSKDESIEKIKEYCRGKIKVESKFFEYSDENKPIKIIEYTREEAEKGGGRENEIENLSSNNKLIIIKNEKNYGFAEGNNIGMRYVLKTLSSDYILLLNNDTVVDPYFLTELVKVAEGDEKIGAIGPDIRLYSDSSKPQIKKYGLIQTVSDIDTLSGACLLLKTAILAKIGLLDPIYFCYDEDRELNERIKRNGYRVVYVPTASKIYHKLEATSKKVSDLKAYYMTRNRFLTVRKHKMNLYGILFLCKETSKDLLTLLIFNKNKKVLINFLGGLRDGFIYLATKTIERKHKICESNKCIPGITTEQAMMNTPNSKKKIKNIILVKKDFTEIHINKDPGQIPFYLSKLGYNVDILTYLSSSNRNLRLRDGVRLVKIKESRFNFFNSMLFPLLLYILRRKEEIDCIISYHWIRNVIISIIFKLIIKSEGIFIVKMDSDGKLAGNSFIRASIVWFVLRILSFTSDLIIIESPEAKKRMLNRYPWLRNKLVMLPNGINQSMFDELSRSVESKERKEILYVGRIEYAKGVDLLIKAFSKLKNKYPDWKIVLVGQIVSSFKEELKRLIFQQDLKDRVELTGPLYGKDLVERYINAKIFCFPSRDGWSFISTESVDNTVRSKVKPILRSESFGLVLVEAMYFNNAVISSDVGAARYVCDYGGAGLIFKPENVEELTRGLDKLIGDEQLRSRLAIKAKARCEKLFNWEKIVEKLHFYIQSIV